MSTLTSTTNQTQKMHLLGASCMKFLLPVFEKMYQGSLYGNLKTMLLVYSAKVTSNLLPVHQLLNQTVTSCPFCAVWLCLYMAH